ncbi:MAG: (d)CMP kinase [Planctomycetota bacterium]
MESKKNAVAIDGPAGAGKSTVAKRVAESLGFLFVDTGAMYRAVTLTAERQGVDMEDAEEMGRTARAIEITFDETGRQVFVNGEDVSSEIRTPELTAKIKYAASSAPVRTELVAQQQQIAEKRPVVMEGRDITTVVLPDAKWRIYLDASVECRAERRMKDFAESGEAADLNKIMEEIEARDRSDFEREVGPLKRIPEQIYVDTSEMTQDEVIDHIVGIVKNG